MRPHQQRGFVLVTSLIVLALITLLAVTAIDSATLQERMASNLRDRSQTRQAADAGLRAGERLIAAATSAEIAAGGGCYPGRCAIGIEGRAYFNAAVWRDPAVVRYRAGTATEHAPVVEYLIEALPPEPVAAGSLRASACARPERCALRYRITARAKGDNPAAIAIVQSHYRRYD